MRPVLPKQLILRAANEVWGLSYVNEFGLKHGVIERAGRSLALNSANAEGAFHLLEVWLRQRARAILLPWLARVSEQTGLAYSGARVKSQRTRWGSCSVHRSINLNDRLLFLPPPLVHYVMVHELCHTVHLNHARSYWKLVGSLVPDYPKREAGLRCARDYLPACLAH